MTRAPALFVSHGAPTLALEENATVAALRNFAAAIAKPSAILSISAHWEADPISLSTAQNPKTIHDFRGFPAPLYSITYPAPGAPELAARAQALLNAAGYPARLDPERGFDHGTWVPARILYPDANIPVLSMAVNPRRDAAFHAALGRALAPLRDEGVMILGSGSATHDLSRLVPDGGPADPRAVAFADWLEQALTAVPAPALLDWEKAAPFARANHPTPEHLLPLFPAWGAGGGGPATRLTRGYRYGALAMDCYVWGV